MSTYGSAAPGARGPHRDRLPGLALAAMVMVGLLPFVLVSLPSMTDLPGHIGRYQVMMEGARSEALQQYYAFEWRLVGNLGVDLIVRALAPLLGVEKAALVAVAAIPALTIAGIAAVSRAIFGRIEPAAALACCFVFSNPFMFGFVNYCLAVALALLTFALWVRMREGGRARQAIVLAPAIFLVWLAHAMGFGLLALLVAGYEGERLWRQRAEPLVPRLVDVAVRGLPFLVPIALTLLWRGEAAGELFGYGSDLIQRKLMNLVVVLRGQSVPLDLGTPVVIAGTLALLLWRRLVVLEMRLVAPGLLILAACLLMPTTLFGSWGADERLAPAAALVLSMAVRWTGSGRQAALLVALGTALFTVRTVAIAQDWRRLDAAYASHLRGLELVPLGARIHAVVLQDECHGRWLATAYPHLPSIAIARRDALVNSQWPMAGAALLRVTEELPAELRNDPSQFVVGRDCGGARPDPLVERVAQLPRDRLDYLWVLETRGPAPVLTGLSAPIFADDNSALYKLD